MVCKCVDCGRVVDEGYAMSPINDGEVYSDDFVLCFDCLKLMVLMMVCLLMLMILLERCGIGCLMMRRVVLIVL